MYMRLDTFIYVGKQPITLIFYVHLDILIYIGEAEENVNHIIPGCVLYNNIVR